MDNWEKQLINWLNNAENEFNLFLGKVNQDFEKKTSELQKIVDTVTEEIENNIPQEFDNILIEIDGFFEEVITILIEENPFDLVDYFWEDQESQVRDQNNDLAWYEEDKVNPNAQFHPACVGCRNYHGRSYNGTLLVCGIHPYGWDDENCPDWQKIDDN